MALGLIWGELLWDYNIRSLSHLPQRFLNQPEGHTV